MEHKHTPTPLVSVTGLPSEFSELLRERGIHSCEQLYAELCLVPGHVDGDSEVEEVGQLARILGSEGTRSLRARLEDILPVETRASLSEAAQTKWTEVRPLGVPSERPEAPDDAPEVTDE